MRVLARKMAACTLGGALLILAGGCSLKMTEVDKDILTDYSPEWASMKNSREQRVYQIVETVDTNLRELNDDVDAVLLLDRPLRLSKMPMR